MSRSLRKRLDRLEASLANLPRPFRVFVAPDWGDEFTPEQEAEKAALERQGFNIVELVYAPMESPTRKVWDEGDEEP